jgi:hypothetical protein
MSMSRRLAVVATALGTVTAGLFTGAVSTANASSTSAAATQTVEVFIKRDHTVVMPTEIRPGVSKFVISSRRAAGFQLAQAAEGYTKAEAIRDINAAFTKNNMKALRRFEANLTLLGGMPSTREKTATMSVNLDAGTYWAFDSMPQNLDPATVLSFEVAGESVGGTLSGHLIRSTGEHTWGKASPRIPTRGRVLFQNTSDVPHFIAIAKLAKGKTMKDFRAWVEELKKGNETPPPVNFRISLDTGVISGGESMALKYRLPAGRYVMTCWWPDSDMGGMPHALMGMYRGLKVG